MKLEVVKQTTNSVNCINGFYSKTTKCKNIYIYFNILLTFLQVQIYLWKVAANSK